MFHGEGEVILLRLIQAGVTFGIGLLIIKIIMVLERRGLKKSDVDEALYLFVQRATKIVLWIALIITVLQVIGVKTSSLIAMLGAAGAAIALALKDSLSNVAGGIIILVTKPFRKGDYIEIQGQDIEGVVDNIDLLTTRIHSSDNKVLTIPNGNVTTNAVVNHTMEDIRRVDFEVGVSYDGDVDAARAKLIEIAKRDDRILRDPEPFSGVTELADSSVGVVLKVWTKTENYWDVDYYLKESVFKEFANAGIDIPYNQLDVNLKK